NTEYFLFKHVAHVIVALVIMFLVHLIPYTRFIRYTRLAVFVSIVLLFLTLFAGVSVNDAARWLEIPLVGYRFQPSEFAKIALIKILDVVLARHVKGTLTPKELLMQLIAFNGIICFFIALSNVSTAVLPGAVSLLLLSDGNVPT